MPEGLWVGPGHYDTEAGIASFLVATGEMGTLKLNASGEGLRSQKTVRLKD
ncbi:MAG: hypothetical protein V8S95_04215 [Odoribacter sp.]